MVSREEINKGWNNHWENNHSPWDMAGGNPYLNQHFQTMVGNNADGKRIMVPLCGATVDMAWFYKQGLTVVGVEFSEIACKHFFERLSLDYSIEKHDNYTVYTHDERLKIYQCDFFNTTAAMLGGCFDFCFDVGGLVAMIPEEHQKYINHLDSLFSASIVVLLECFEYDASVHSGPPHSIPTATLEKLLDGKFKKEELSRIKQGDLPPEYTARTGFDNTRVLYLVKRV
ncbi:thiopurine S-methyltransferase-like [Hydractinia symbiolongicarpus]|uniref:thiopurine S-methyltransferase-like n=1 Tax=Hydractinia symbiolongicarpus TaxID=13093 RepID=UPI00254A3654|nr:thiopurine S-methyltransferase-like [Hydractinia symbiolongicarpus]